MSATGRQTDGFWEYLHRLLDDSRLVIDRPKHSRHPRFPEVVYPLDYGFLEGTTAADGGGIDVWVGSQGQRPLSGVICTVDLQKRDTEVKILLGCTQEEAGTILDFHNENGMRAIWIPCPKERR